MAKPDQIQGKLAAIGAASIVGLGDNVLDCYLHEDLAYPGGNALNVAAYSRLFFNADAGFLGIMGTDRFADHLAQVLDTIGVRRERVRRAVGANGMAFVALDDEGDRRFVGTNRGGVQDSLRIRLTEKDFDYLEGFSRVHTSVYSAIEPELEKLTERGIALSYDYSNDAHNDVVRVSAPHVEVGFFSGGGLSESQVESLGRDALAMGISRVVVTLGARGARAFESGMRSAVDVVPVDAIDALGAGDAFITGFLAAQGNGSDLDQCMSIAAMSGALACTLRGAFGYSVVAGEDAREQLVRLSEQA